MIVSAMPGTGKSHCADNHPETCVDVESSRFRNVDGGHDWGYYIRAIKAANKNYDIVLVSSHDVLRRRLRQNGLDFCFVAYRTAGMQEAKNRVASRDTQQPNDVIAAVLERSWDEWMATVDVGAPLAVYRLAPGQYVEDVLTDITATTANKGSVSVDTALDGHDRA